MTQGKLWGGLIVLFLAGVLTGIVGTTWYGHHERERQWERGPAARQERMMKRLTRELELTRGQRGLIEPIVHRAHVEILQLRFQHQAEIEGILAKAMADLKIELSPEQDAKLDELYLQVQRRWETMRDYLQTGEGGMKQPQ